MKYCIIWPCSCPRSTLGPRTLGIMLFASLNVATRTQIDLESSEIPRPVRAEENNNAAALLFI